MTLMLSTDYMSYREIEAKITNLYHYYNGKVNKILPSTGLNFTNSQYVSAGSCDRTNGVILFSLPKMVEMVNKHMFKDIALEELKSIYEDMQIALMDGSYNELYSKGLKRK